MSVRAKILAQIAEIGKTLYGMEDIIKIYCLSKASDLTVLLLGCHATAKSTLARMWSITTGLNYRVVTSCVDEQTEVLTENGWKFFKDLKEEEKLATLNLETGQIEFQKPLRLYVYDYDGPMLEMKARWLDLLVTPNHKMVVAKHPFSKKKEWILQTVSELGHNKQFKKDGLWTGPHPEFIELPTTSYLKRSRTIKETRTVPVVPFLKFLGYYLAEGSFDSHKRDPKYGGYFYRITVDLYDKELCLDCKQALEDMGFNASLSSDGMSVLCYAKQLYDYVKQFGHAHEKFIPKDVKQLDASLLKILWEAWNAGDGHKVRGKWKVGTTVSKRLADDLQEIALKIGVSAAIKQQRGNISFIKGRPIKSQTIYRILISHRNLQPRACFNKGYRSSYSERWVHYSGKVYCAETPNHTLYVRRNGIPIWSGNSEVDESLIAYIDPAVFREKNIVQMRRGELMEKDHIIVDEYFLWLNKYRAKLHQLLEERTYAGLDSLVKTYSFLCLDEETEVLTKQGWKSFKEISLGDEVLSLNTQTNKLEWSPLLALWHYDYSGPMVVVEDRDLSLLVTPNHRFLVLDKRKNDLVWRLAVELKAQRDKIPQIREVALEEKEKILSDDEVRLMAWLKAEGRLEPGNTLLIYQSEGPFVNEITQLLQRLHLSFTLHSRVRPSHTKEYIWTIKAKDGKRIKELVKDKILRVSDLHLMTPEQLRIYYDTLIKGDGWRAEKQKNWEMFCSKNKESIDTFQYLATLLGLRCTIKKRIGRINNGLRKGTPYVMWYAYIPKTKKDHLIRHKQIIQYTGKIWCLTTKFGNFLVRRNGKIHITGNSNPLSDYYAGQIPEINMATMDRIDLLIPINQPGMVPAETMIRKFSQYGRKERPLDQVITWDEYLKARDEIAQIKVPSRVVIWLTLFAHAMASCKHVTDKWSVSTAKMKKICAGCNENAHICSKVALSKPRFLRATILLAKGLAWLGGQDSVTFEHVNEAIKYTLPHRISWLQEELSYSESLEQVSELIQQFNDEMLAWKNRGIFSNLGKIIESSKKIPPVFEDELAQQLLLEVSEIHLLKSFVNETITSVKEDIKKFYFTEGTVSNFNTLEEAKLFLEQSNLSAYEKEEMLFKILRENPLLYTKLETTEEAVEKLTKVVVKLHKQFKEEIGTEDDLLKRFVDSIAFDSDLLKMKEEKGIVEILFKDSETRKSFLDLWRKCNVGIST